MTNIYFNGEAGNPVLLAEQNLSFFVQFVAEQGCSPVHAYLWPGKTIAGLTEDFTRYAACVTDDVIKTKAVELEKSYRKLYYILTNSTLTIM